MNIRNIIEGKYHLACYRSCLLIIYVNVGLNIVDDQWVDLTVLWRAAVTLTIQFTPLEREKGRTKTTGAGLRSICGG